MKLKTISLIIAAFGFASYSNAQYVNVGPSPSLAFNAFVFALESSVDDLYTNHGDTGYSSFVFSYDNGGNTSFFVDEDSVFDNSYSSLGNDLFFREHSNFEYFESDGVYDVGFFGFEAGDDNTLLVEYYDELDQILQTETLFTHSVNSPPDSVRVSENPQNIGNLKFSFAHNNPVIGINRQDDSDRFKLFRSYNPNTLDYGNEWILAIDDREDSLVDHDDGFFYIQSSITPVPEPSTIGLIAVFGTIAIALLKRRKTSK